MGRETVIRFFLDRLIHCFPWLAPSSAIQSLLPTCTLPQPRTRHLAVPGRIAATKTATPNHFETSFSSEF